MRSHNRQMNTNSKETSSGHRNRESRVNICVLHEKFSGLWVERQFLLATSRLARLGFPLSRAWIKCFRESTIIPSQMKCLVYNIFTISRTIHFTCEYFSRVCKILNTECWFTYTFGFEEFPVRVSTT